MRNKSYPSTFRFMCIGGMPKYDQMAKIAGHPYKIHSIIHLQDDGVKIEAISYKGFSTSKYDVLSSYIIPEDRLVTLDLITRQNIEEKQKSVIGRGITGAVLFGPVGAIVGGISGVGSKKKSNTTAVLCLAYETKDGNYGNMIFDITPTMVSSRPIELIQAYFEKYGRPATVIQPEEDADGNVVL